MRIGEITTGTMSNNFRLIDRYVNLSGTTTRVRSTTTMIDDDEVLSANGELSFKLLFVFL